MLFDNLFNMMSPAVTLGLLGGLVGVVAMVTAFYVRWESKDCAISNRDYRLH